MNRHLFGREFFRIHDNYSILLKNYFGEKGGSLDVIWFNIVDRFIAANFLVAFIASERLMLKIRQKRASHLWEELLIEISEISIMKNRKRSIFWIRDDG